MARDRTRPIVLGVDGSEDGRTAARWAAREAVRAGRSLRIVHGFIWPQMRVPLGPSRDGRVRGLRADAEQILSDAADQAQAAAPEVEVTTALVTGAAAPVLVRESHEAAYLVVGSRGTRGFAELLVGSVALQLAQYAVCPVVVVRPAHTAPGEGRVVVGVDGSDEACNATRFAVAAALERRTGLRVLGASPDRDGDAEARRGVDTAVALARELEPEVEVTGEVVDGHPGGVLVHASAESRLLVVGSRGRGGFREMLLGSVSRAVLEHSACPVAIVRRRPDAEPGQVI